MSIKDMIEELVAYYEAAGFADFYEREIKGRSDEEIRKLYEKTFDEDGDDDTWF